MLLKCAHNGLCTGVMSARCCSFVVSAWLYLYTSPLKRRATDEILIRELTILRDALFGHVVRGAWVVRVFDGR